MTTTSASSPSVSVTMEPLPPSPEPITAPPTLMASRSEGARPTVSARSTMSGGRSSMMRPSMAGGARPSLAAAVRASLSLGPSLVKDTANLFAENKIEDVHLEIFSNDVVMEGELSKKGEGGFQSWKNRVFVLRGQELSYYLTVTNGQRYGALKGSFNIRDAQVERLDQGNSFAIMLPDQPQPRILAAPNVQALMDWMTAISLAAEAHIMEPTSNISLVDHSRSTHIIFVRHGQYVTSQTPAMDMQGPLTDLGREQARQTGKFLSEYLSARKVLQRYPQFPVYHSGVTRAEQTATIIAQQFPNNHNGGGGVYLRENKLFREAWPGNPLPSKNQKIMARENLDNMVADCARLKVLYRTMFRHLIPDDLRTTENELSEAEKAAFTATFGSTTQSRVGDRYRVIVCHANIIRWFVCKAMGVDPDGSWGRMRHSHCGITAMEVDSVGNVQLTYVNQTGHLQTTMITES